MTTGKSMSDPRTDAELLDSVRSRDDREALTELLERHQAAIWRFGMRMCRDVEDAKDVLQETMLAVARTAGDFRGSSSVPTWLFAIARSFCIKKRRRSKFAPDEVVNLDDVSANGSGIRSDGPSPDEIASNRELAAVLERAIEDLERDQREVLLLRDVEGLSAPDVGKVLGVSIQAVKSRLHRARVALREKLSPPQGDLDLMNKHEGCPDIVPVFSRFVEGEIGADECAQMQKHIDTCPPCRIACDTLKSTLSLCRAKARGGTVPPEVQQVVRDALREIGRVTGADRDVTTGR